MKPHRLTLTNALVLGYGLDKQIHNIYDPPAATREELLAYHNEDYVDFLSRSVCFVNAMNTQMTNVASE
jgi:acetoin utilization deacetylase AcuC-like enzyme